jgi:hypothetical protein
MQYIVVFEDGEVISSSEKKWGQIKKLNKKIGYIKLYDRFNKEHILENFDVYFFSDEATYIHGRNKFIWENRLLGGFSKKTGLGKLIKAPVYQGETETEEVDLEEYKKKYNDLAFIETPCDIGDSFCDIKN